MNRAHKLESRVPIMQSTDVAVRRVRLENVHMLRRPASLFHPGIVALMLRRALSRDAVGRAGTTAQLVGEA